MARLNRPHLLTVAGNKKPTEDFLSLIERAAILLVTSSTGDVDDELAQELYERANDCMIQAAHSPFLAGQKRCYHTLA